MDRELLNKYSEGIIGMSACLGGEVAKSLEVDDYENARRIVGEYRDILGPEGFWLEMMDHGLPEQTALNPKLLRLSKETGAGVVATNDLHYVRKDQHEAHDVLLCVGTGSNLDTPNRLRFETDEFYLKTAAEMETLFKDVPEALTNSKRIAEMTDLQITFGELRLPHFPVPDGYTVETWLREECERGLARALRPGHRLSSRSASTTSSASSSAWATRPTSSSSPTSCATPASRASPPPAVARRRARS